MPRRRTSESITSVLTSAENLRNAVNALPEEMREKTRELALAIVGTTPKRRGRPPRKRGKRRGRPRKRIQEKPETKQA